MNELVFVSLERWDEIWRRNQFICDGLVRRHPALRILFVGPEGNISYALRSGQWESVQSSGPFQVDAEGRIQCFRPLKWLPNSWGWSRKMNEWGVRRQLRRKMAALGMNAPILWINAHHAGHLAGRVGEQGVIYDVTDDWTEFGSERERSLVRQQDTVLCRKANAVIVCSQRLLELKRDLAREVHLIPNGVDFEHYAGASLKQYEGGGRNRNWPSPVLGYVGSIHPERVDVSLVELLARSLPHATIVLAGPDMLAAGERQRLLNCANIRMTGPVSYAVIPELMQAFDVCLVPHVVTPFTESLNPIKLWEYLAMGKPIVATPVAGFREHAALVSLAGTPSEFVAACRVALGGEDPIRTEQRRAIAMCNSWSERLDRIEKVIAAVSRGEEDAAECISTV